MYTIYREIDPVDGGNVYTVRDDMSPVVWRIGTDCLSRGADIVCVEPGDRVALYDGTALEVMDAPGHPGHMMFCVGNNLFTGVADYREAGMRDAVWGRNVYPGRGPVLDIYSERG